MDHILYDGPYYVSPSPKWTIFAKFAKCVYIYIYGPLFSSKSYIICMDNFQLTIVYYTYGSVFSSQCYVICMDHILAHKIVIYVWTTLQLTMVCYMDGPPLAHNIICMTTLWLTILHYIYGRTFSSQYFIISIDHFLAHNIT